MLYSARPPSSSELIPSHSIVEVLPFSVMEGLRRPHATSTASTEQRFKDDLQNLVILEDYVSGDMYQYLERRADRFVQVLDQLRMLRRQLQELQRIGEDANNTIDSILALLRQELNIGRSQLGRMHRNLRTRRPSPSVVDEDGTAATPPASPVHDSGYDTGASHLLCEKRVQALSALLDEVNSQWRLVQEASPLEESPVAVASARARNRADTRSMSVSSGERREPSHRRRRPRTESEAQHQQELERRLAAEALADFLGVNVADERRHCAVYKRDKHTGRLVHLPSVDAVASAGDTSPSSSGVHGVRARSRRTLSRVAVQESSEAVGDAEGRRSILSPALFVRLSDHPPIQALAQEAERSLRMRVEAQVAHEYHTERLMEVVEERNELRAEVAELAVSQGWLPSVVTEALEEHGLEPIPFCHDEENGVTTSQRDAPSPADGAASLSPSTCPPGCASGSPGVAGLPMYLSSAISAERRAALDQSMDQAEHAGTQDSRSGRRTAPLHIPSRGRRRRDLDRSGHTGRSTHVPPQRSVSGDRGVVPTGSPAENTWHRVESAASFTSQDLRDYQSLALGQSDGEEEVGATGLPLDAGAEDDWHGSSGLTSQRSSFAVFSTGWGSPRDEGQGPLDVADLWRARNAPAEGSPARASLQPPLQHRDWGGAQLSQSLPTSEGFAAARRRGNVVGSPVLRPRNSAGSQDDTLQDVDLEG